MSETTTEVPPAEAAQPTQETPKAPESPQDTTDWKAEARKWEERAKANQKAARDLEEQRRASMTEAEKAVAEAEERGRTAARAEFSRRIATTEFQAAAARRNPEFDAAKALKWLDVAGLIGDDGEPDLKAVHAAVEELIPSPTAGTPSFDGGARTTPAPPQTMTGLIRKGLGRS